MTWGANILGPGPGGGWGSQVLVFEVLLTLLFWVDDPCLGLFLILTGPLTASEKDWQFSGF